MARKGAADLGESERVDAYFVRVQEAKRDEEKTREQALLLIIGGALTLSFQLVASMYEKRDLVAIGWLASSWIVWALALVATLLNYSLSISWHEYILTEVAGGERDPVKLTPPWTRWIDRINAAVLVGTVVGFFLFGIFSLQNLTAPKTTKQAVASCSQQINAPAIRKPIDTTTGGASVSSNEGSKKGGVPPPQPPPSWKTLDPPQAPPDPAKK